MWSSNRWAFDLALNYEAKSLKGSRILVLGLSYMTDMDTEF